MRVKYQRIPSHQRWKKETGLKSCHGVVAYNKSQVLIVRSFLA